jgi:hypothetical protein
VVPQHEVGAEEGAGDPGQACLARGARAVSASLAQASRAGGGRAYAQRKNAAVDGSTSASRTKMAEKAMVRAPMTAVSTGR